jgi:hypothetical protein
MKRLYPWVMGVGLLGAGCSPKSDVQPGAPVLLLMTIAESGGVTDITGGEPACSTQAKEGAKCDAMKDDPLCQSAKSWCRCRPNDPTDPMSDSSWTCQFEPTSMVLAAFDRLLDTEPLDYDQKKAAGRTDVAKITAAPGKPPEETVTDYAANGSEIALIFKLLANTFHGPHLIISGSPALPSGSAITVTLDKTKVRAKDHASLFVGSGAIKDGVLSFATAPFAASIGVPMAEPPPPVDAGSEADGGASDAPAEAGSDGGASGDGSTDGGALDALASDAAAETAPPPQPLPVMAGMQSVTIGFNNLTDQAQIIAQVTVTVDGKPFSDFDIAATDAMNPTDPARAYAVTPKMGVSGAPGASWPAGSVITITVGAAAADLQGVTLGAPASATFVTEK